MNNTIYKAIMVRSLLRNKCLKLKTIKSRLAYTQQRNYCCSLIRQAKRNFYENLDPNLITDNRKFWKQVKPFFSNKTPKNTNIMLLEGDKIITEPAACAEIFNNYFSGAVSKLVIDRSLHVISVTNSDHPVDRAIEMYKNHPSILKINQLRYPCDNFFSGRYQRVVLLNLLRTLIPLKHTKKIIYLLKY